MTKLSNNKDIVEAMEDGVGSVLILDVSKSKVLLTMDDKEYRINRPSQWLEIEAGDVLDITGDIYYGKGKNTGMEFGKLTIVNNHGSITSPIHEADEIEDNEPMRADENNTLNISGTPLLRYLIESYKIKMEYLTLNDGQKIVYDAVMGGSDLVSITSAPGAGKTYLSGVIARAIGFYRKKYMEISAVAPSHKAKKVLSESLGFDANTIHRHCGYTLNDSDAISVDDSGDLMKVRETEDVDVLIVDEISMVTNDLFMDAVKSAKIVIALGDKNQLPVIKGIPADLSNFEEYELTQQMRQKDTSKLLYQTIVGLKYSIENNKAFTPLGYDDSLIRADSLSELYLNGDIEVIGAFTNAYVDGYNKYIQNKLRGTEDVCDGDKMILQAPMKTAVSRGNKTIYPIVANNGDEIKILSVDRKYMSSIATVDIEGYGKRLLVPGDFYKTKRGTTDAWKLYQKEFRHIQWKDFKASTIIAKLPYAMTIHKLQGSTYENIGIDVGNIMFSSSMEQRNRLMYVGISRAKSKCYIKA